MALTVFPTILFDTSTGSDTAASGAGPATALTGTGCAVTSGSTSVTISDAVALGGVAVDGSAVLWVNTASGRQYTRISTVSGSSGAWTLVVEDSVWTTGTALTWGIGGKRNSFDNANSRKVFTADAKPGWTIQTGTNQSISSTITLTTAVGTSSGQITVKGDSQSTRRVITQTANTSHINGAIYYYNFKNLSFVNSNATKTNATAISYDAGGFGQTTTFINCLFGDATNKLLHAISRAATANPLLTLIGCEVAYCTSYGMDFGCGSSGIGRLRKCNVHDNGGDGVYVQFTVYGFTIIEGCTIWNNTGKGLNFQNSGSNAATAHVTGNTFHNNTSDGVYIPAVANWIGAVVTDNSITKNGGYGINYGGSAGDQTIGAADYNNFGTGSTANTSGAVNGFTQGANSINLDPGYASASTGDFTPSNAATRVASLPPGYPTSGNSPWIGAVPGASAGGGAVYINKITNIYLSDDGGPA